MRTLFLFISLLSILACSKNIDISSDVTGFQAAKDGAHYLIVPSSEKQMASIKESITDYLNYHAEAIRISHIKLEGVKNVLVLRRFENFKTAQAFAEKLKKKTDVESLAISQLNYRTTLKQQTTDNYKQYYDVVLNK